MRISGWFSRTLKEIRFVTLRDWSFEDVGNFWDSVHDYDEIDDETYAYKRRFYDSIKMCSFPNNSTVLDIDCRTGNGTIFYHSRNKIKKSVCVGFSQVFLKVAQKRLKKYSINAQTMLLRNVPINLKEKSFDAILCFETIEHVSNHKKFLNELNRLLKDNGELILTMPNILWEPVHWLTAIFGIHHSEGPHRFQRKRKIVRLLKKLGFKITKHKTTVFIPAGPRWLTRIGEILEKLMGKKLMHLIGLRHIFICKKVREIKK